MGDDGKLQYEVRHIKNFSESKKTIKKVLPAQTQKPFTKMKDEDTIKIKGTTYYVGETLAICKVESLSGSHIWREDYSFGTLTKCDSKGLTIQWNDAEKDPQTCRLSETDVDARVIKFKNYIKKFAKYIDIEQERGKRFADGQ